MTQENIHIENLYTKDGKLNSAIIRQKWFKESLLYRQIMQTTSFLDISTPFSARLYVYKNKLNSIPVCGSCGKPTQWSPNKKQYNKTCNNNNCIRKNKNWKSCSKTKLDNHKNNKAHLLDIFKQNKYQLLDKCQLKEKLLLKIENKNRHNVPVILSSDYKDVNFLCSILYYTKELSIIQDLQWRERIYLILNDLPNIPKCDCGKRLKFISISNGYSTACSRNCHLTNIKQKITEDIISQGFKILSDFNHLNSGAIELKCERCLVAFKKELTNARWKDVTCPNCFIQTTISSGELEIYNFIKEILPNEKIISNDRTLIYPKELDLYLPNKKIAIEYDGVFWHSNLKKPNKYHLEKSQKCQDKDVFLIHIHETEWTNKQDIVKSILRSKLAPNTMNRIYGRKCTIREIDSNTSNKFLIENHLQGKCRSQLRLGMFYNDTLVSLITLGKRKIHRGEMKWELLRYCTLKNHSVIGGFSKLISFFEKNYNIPSFITYADKRYSNGDVYLKNNFTYIKDSAVGYWYINANNPKTGLLHRSMFMKHKLADKLVKFDSNKTEEFNMMNNGFLKYYDCGQLIFEKKNPNLID